jgi:5'(3')-deoxyribonucleotidase
MNKKPLLIDMDCILVDMLPWWLGEYSRLSGEKITLRNIVEYEVRNLISNPSLFDKILHTRGFFSNLPPMPGAVKYLNKLIEEGYDIVILTQPPRKADYAIKEKRIWMQRYFPSYGLANMVFAHRKDLVDGCLLFDDKPSHLEHWKDAHPEGITATIEYPYNRSAPVDKRFTNRRNAWKKFYEWVTSLEDIKARR